MHGSRGSLDSGLKNLREILLNVSGYIFLRKAIWQLRSQPRRTGTVRFQLSHSENGRNFYVTLRHKPGKLPSQHCAFVHLGFHIKPEVRAMLFSYRFALYAD